MKEKRVHYTATTTPISTPESKGIVEKADLNMLLTYQEREGIPTPPKRSLSYYSDILNTYSKSNKIFSVAFPEDLVSELNSLSQELAISRNKLIKIATLFLMDGLGRLKKRPKVVYINMLDLEASKRSIQSLLSMIGIKAKITKIVKSAKGSMLFIHLSDGRIIHLDIRERRGSVKKSASHGLITLEDFMLPEGFEIEVEG